MWETMWDCTYKLRSEKSLDHLDADAHPNLSAINLVRVRQVLFV